MAMSTGKVVALIQAMGGADPAVIEAKVEEWLDAHPEATTTVQDGSITEQKLATAVAQKLGLISSLSDEIDGIESALNNFTEEVTENVALTFTSATGYINKNGVAVTFADMEKASISVTPNDVYYLTSKSYYSMARAVFLDSLDAVVADDIIWTDDTNLLHEDTRIVVPADAETMLIQTHANNELYVELSKATGYIAVASKLSENLSTELYADVDIKIDEALTNVADRTYEAETLSFSDATGYYNNLGEFIVYSDIKKASVSVVKNEKYLLTSKSFYSIARAVLFDSDNNIVEDGIIWTDSSETLHTDTPITIPNGAVSMLIQAYSNAVSSVVLKKATGYKAKVVDSILNGKKVTLIGDSITAHNFRAKTNWAMWMSEWTGTNVQNLGIGGTGFRATPVYYDRIASIQATPDIIGIALSWNDGTSNIGDITDTTGTSLCALANQFFDALITAYPTTPIISYSQGPWSEAKHGNSGTDEWISKYAQICERKGVPFYPDLYDGCVLKPWLDANKNVYYKCDDDESEHYGETDGTHPNSEGHKVIARCLYPYFAKNIVAEGLDYGSN